MTGRLTVTTEELKQTAKEFEQTVQRIDNCFSKIRSTSDRTSGCWRGEAGDMDRAGYDEYNEVIETLITRLREHPVDLLQMAGVYESAENEAKSIAGALPTDPIV